MMSVKSLEFPARDDADQSKKSGLKRKLAAKSTCETAVFGSGCLANPARIA